MKLLYLSMVSLVFIASSALALNGKKITFITIEKPKKLLNPLPVLSTNFFPVVSAQGALAVDISSGVTLYEKDADLRLLPASTTKIMTALVALDSYPLDKILKVDGLKIDGQKMGLIKGEEISVENLLYGLLVYSANDAAEILAINYPEGREAFVDTMNKKAKELSLENTNFANPIGFDDTSHFSTARDMIRLASIAMENPLFSKIVGTKKIEVKSIDGKITHSLTNINTLLGEVPGVLGVKTGWTEGARENLVSFIDRDERKILITILGSQDRFGETKEIIDWIFKSYHWKEMLTP